MIELSIIIPIYNCERYIEKCVQSIMAYNEESVKIEVILVNDGSTDSSGEICSKLAEKYHNVVVLAQKNAGCAAARNFGLRYAQGNLVWYIDADDYVAKNAVPEILQAFKEEDTVDFISFNCVTVFQNHSVPKTQASKKEYLDRAQALENVLYQDKITLSACDKVFRRSFLGVDPFPAGIPMGEEQIAISRLISRVNKILVLPDYYYYYVQRASSESHFPGKKGSEKMKLLYDTYCDVAKELEKSAPDFTTAINARLVSQGVGVIGWMARSKTCNKELGKRITKNIRSSLIGYWKNSREDLPFKLAATLASLSYKLVYFAYRMFLWLRPDSNLAD